MHVLQVRAPIYAGPCVSSSLLCCPSPLRSSSTQHESPPANANFVVRGYSFGSFPSEGAPIKCGGTIRLKHVATGCLLHSHAQFKSPLSANQEVSAVGCPSSPNHVGDADPSDNWVLECNSNANGYWMRSVSLVVEMRAEVHANHRRTPECATTTTTIRLLMMCEMPTCCSNLLNPRPVSIPTMFC